MSLGEEGYFLWIGDEDSTLEVVRGRIEYNDDIGTNILLMSDEVTYRALYYNEEKKQYRSIDRETGEAIYYHVLFLGSEYTREIEICEKAIDYANNLEKHFLDKEDFEIILAHIRDIRLMIIRLFKLEFLFN